MKKILSSPCDLACIYDARCGVGNYSPLFDPKTYKPLRLREPGGVGRTAG